MLLRSFFLLAVLLAIVIDGKGISSSRFGGSVRSYKSGYYSRSSRYYVGYMYWGSRGYRGTRYRSTTKGTAGTAVNGVQAADQNVMDNAFCKRDVRVDGPSNGNIPSWANKKFFVLNSTQNCVQQLSTQPGSPKNTQILDLQLNRFRWQMEGRQVGAPAKFPLIDFANYADMDAPTPTLTMALELVRINFRKADGTLIRAVSLDQVELRPCGASGCGTNEMPYPGVTRMDFSKQLNYTLRGVSQDLTFDLDFTLTDDFAEDPDDQHIFLRPSSMKIDFTLQMTTIPTDESYVDIEAIVFHPKTGVASSIVKASVTDARLPVEYDPKLMSRYAIGNPTDSDQGFVSWWSTMDNDNLCLSPSRGSPCVTGEDPVLYCDTGSQDAACAGQDLTVRVGHKLNWKFQQAVRDWTDGAAEWYINFAYQDPGETTDPGSAGAIKMSLAVILVMILMVL